MRIVRICCWMFCFVLFVGCEPGREVQEEDTSKVLARIGEETVTQKDVDYILNSMQPSWRQRYEDPGEFFKLVELLVIERIKAKEARKLGLDRDPIVIEELARRERIELKKALDRYRKEEIVTEEAMRKYYDDSVETVFTEERTWVRHILVEEEKTAQKVLKELKAGGDFRKMAEKYSTDQLTAKHAGDLGYVVKGRSLDPEFEKVAFALTQPGEISEIVKSAFGYHIIFCVDPPHFRVHEYDAAKMSIRAYLEREAVVEYTEALKEAADIEYFIEMPAEEPAEAEENAGEE